MTVYLKNSLQKVPCMHHIFIIYNIYNIYIYIYIYVFLVLANPMHVFNPTQLRSHLPDISEGSFCLAHHWLLASRHTRGSHAQIARFPEVLGGKIFAGSVHRACLGLARTVYIHRI